MKILVINAGSSSLKYQLIDMENESLLAKGLCERIGIDGRLTHKPQNDKPVYEADVPFPTHKEAIEAVLEKLTSKEYGVVETMAEIGAVGHRVLHGGIEFTESCVVDDACEAAIKKCFPLGPLHNPANLMGIKACQAAMPGVPQVAVFDTSFGMSMTPEAYIYAIPYEYYENDSIRRYGFHGTSHRFVSARACEIMGKKGTRVINCHLGNGSSVSASIDGKCDVNILLMVNPKINKITTISIPRDSYVPNPALNYGSDKLTHLGNNGPENSIAGIEEFWYQH